MFDPNGEVAGRTPAVALVAREEAQALAERFHEAYERLAPSFGYETREETRQFDPDSKNGRLMVDVCAEIHEALFPRIARIRNLEADNERLVEALEECEPHVFRKELWGQVNAALRQHKEIFGE